MRALIVPSLLLATASAAYAGGCDPLGLEEGTCYNTGNYANHTLTAHHVAPVVYHAPPPPAPVYIAPAPIIHIAPPPPPPVYVPQPVVMLSTTSAPAQSVPINSPSLQPHDQACGRAACGLGQGVHEGGDGPVSETIGTVGAVVTAVGVVTDNAPVTAFGAGISIGAGVVGMAESGAFGKMGIGGAIGDAAAYGGFGGDSSSAPGDGPGGY